jgi:hypothetical protein
MCHSETSCAAALLLALAMRAKVCRYAGNGTKSLCSPTTWAETGWQFDESVITPRVSSRR